MKLLLVYTFFSLSHPPDQPFLYIARVPCPFHPLRVYVFVLFECFWKLSLWTSWQSWGSSHTDEKWILAALSPVSQLCVYCCWAEAVLFRHPWPQSTGRHNWSTNWTMVILVGVNQKNQASAGKCYKIRILDQLLYTVIQILWFMF